MKFLPASMYVHHLCARSLWRSGKGVRCSGAPVTDGFDPPCGLWELHLGCL